MSQSPGGYLNGPQIVGDQIDRLVEEYADNHQTFEEVLPGYIEKALNNEKTLCTATNSPYYKNAVQPELNQPDFLGGENYQLEEQFPTYEHMEPVPMEPMPDNFQSMEFFQQSKLNNDNQMEWSYEQTNQMQGSQETQYYQQSDCIEQGSPNKPIAQQYQYNSGDSQGKTVYLLVPRQETANNAQNIGGEENSGFGLEYSNQYNQPNFAPLANNFLASPPGYPQELQNRCAPHEEQQSGNNNNHNIVSGFANMNIQSPSEHINSGYEFNIIKSEVLQLNNQKETIAPKLKRTRATKRQMSTLSDEDRKERKQIGARKNTAEYNRRKKEKKDELEKKLTDCSEEMEGFKRTWDDCVEGIQNCNVFVSQYPITDFNFYTLQNNFAIHLTDHQKSLDSIQSNNEVDELRNDFENAKNIYQNAVDNVEQKKKNSNTYGSTKSRAKSEMDVAEMKLKVKIIELERRVYSNYWNSLQGFKGAWSNEFRNTLYNNNITLQRMYSMAQNEQEQIDKLLTFFGLPNPT